MSDITLFHDGCNICQGIEATLGPLFGAEHAFESVDLSKNPERAAHAQARGVTRLPSLVIDGRVLRLDDHSPIAHCLAPASQH